MKIVLSCEMQQDRVCFGKFTKCTSVQEKAGDSPKFSFSWRRKNTSQDSTCNPSFVDHYPNMKRTSSPYEQAISAHAAYVKMRWRTQQIENQQKLLKEGSSILSGWVSRRESAANVRYNRRR